MRWSLLLILLGALLFIGGVLFTANQALWKGRLSNANQARNAGTDTLEPREERGSGFGLKANWPGLAMLALGAILLLTGAVV